VSAAEVAKEKAEETRRIAFELAASKEKAEAKKAEEADEEEADEEVEEEEDEEDEEEEEEVKEEEGGQYVEGEDRGVDVDYYDNDVVGTSGGEETGLELGFEGAEERVEDTSSKKRKKLKEKKLVVKTLDLTDEENDAL
jgi:hypothetical protein